MILSRRALQIFFIFYIISWNKNFKLKFFLDCSFRRKADPAWFVVGLLHCSEFFSGTPVSPTP